MAAAPPAPAAPAAAPPAWLRKTGADCIHREMTSLHRSIASGALPGIRGLWPVDNNVMVWRLEVVKFDADTAAGRKLNDDLQTLGSKHGRKYAAVELELRFPDNYPTAPFFLRVVRPHMEQFTGHVTTGGSVCLEALTLSGGPGAWRSDMCVEAVLVMALHNMVHAEEVYVQTTFSRGRAGPLRINMSLGKAGLQEYSLEEANKAFTRLQVEHGWGPPSKGSRGPQAVAPSAAAARASTAGGGAPRFAASLPTASTAPARSRWAPSAAAGAQAQPRRDAVPAPLASLPLARAAAPAAAAAAAKKRPAVEDDEVIVVSDSEDEGPSIPRPPPAKQPRRSALTSGQAAWAGPTGPAARSGGPPQGRLASDDVVDLTGLPAARVGSSNAGRSHSHTPAAGHAPVANHLQTVAQQPAPVPQHVQQLPAEPALEQPRVPRHWQVTEELLRGELVLVDLPLPGAALPQDKRLEQAVAQLVLNGCSREQALDVLDEHGGDAEASLAWLLDKQAKPGMADLLANGLSAEDAEAALRKWGGDVERALAWAFECMEAGGPAAVARRTGMAVGSCGHGAPQADSAAARRRRAQRAQQEAQHRRLQEESARVLQRFVRTGMKKEQVQRIQRVQNLELYEDYCSRRRAKIERRLSEIQKRTGGHSVGALLNERQLFHGADKETLGTIMAQGFDPRVSNMHGALGAGVYFADAASYSDSYSRAPKHSADMADGYPPGFQHLGTGGWRANAHAGLPTSLASRGANAARQHAAAASPPVLAMLLCDVTLGIAGTGKPHMRCAAPGSDSSSSGPPGAAIHAVYHDDQAYPAYIIHYR